MEFLLRPVAWCQLGVKPLQMCIWLWAHGTPAASLFRAKLFRFLRHGKQTPLPGGGWWHQPQSNCFGTGAIVLQTCLSFGSLETPHFSLDQPPRFWMGQKEGEASFTTVALNVFLATSTARRHCAVLSASYKCSGTFFFFSGSCLGLCLLLCSDICKLNIEGPLFFINASLKWKLELHFFN